MSKYLISFPSRAMVVADHELEAVGDAARAVIAEAKAAGVYVFAGGIDEGTPLVLVNGRRGAAFGPFLYAMVLTKGSPDHPAFAGLPPPNTRAHVH